MNSSYPATSFESRTTDDETNVCRICLLKLSNNQLINLFDNVPNCINSDSSKSQTYIDQLNVCVPFLNISEIDPYPHLICTQCCQLLNQAYSFYVLCIESDRKLRQPDIDVYVKIEAKEEPELDVTADIGHQPKSQSNRKRSNIIKNEVAVDKPVDGNQFGPIDQPKKVRKNAARFDENGRYIRRKRIPKYKCEMCGKMMLGKFALEQHIRIHTGERPFVCEICGKAFQTRGCIKKHLECHNENRIKQFKCHLCTYQTARLSHYKKHEIIHTGECPFECQVCSRKFNSHCNLLNHIKRVHAEASIKCEFCDEKFRTLAGLRRHKVRHYRQEHYGCSECKNVYANYKGLKVHMKRHHPGIKFPAKKDSHVINISLTK